MKNSNEEIIKDFDEEFPIQHSECDDCWYSCPLSPDGCCDGSQGDKCNCGAIEKHKELKQYFLSKLSQQKKEIIDFIKTESGKSGRKEIIQFINQSKEN